MATRATSGTGSRGFTLLELLVVIAIVVLIACSWPLASEHLFANQRLRNEIQQLAATLRLAEVSARTSGVPQELIVSPNGGGYAISSTVHNLPDGLTLRLRNSLQAVTNPKLILFPDGSASDAILELATRDKAVSLHVLPMTGRLETTL